MESLRKGQANSTTTSLVSAPPPYDASTSAPPIGKWDGSCYHMWMAQGGTKRTPSLVKITTPDMTPLCTVEGFGSFSQTGAIHIKNAEGIDEVCASLSGNFEDHKYDADIDIHMGPSHNMSSSYTIHLKRDSGAMTRRHKMTLSNGKTYLLKGKHSDSLLMCWGNLKIVEEDSKTKIAEFKVEWPMSVHKVGIVTFESQVEETLVKEMLFAFIGVASREYAVAMASLCVAIPAATVGAA
ncbi:MAG: hypothetical protein Q9200_000370 [Gallowayella weberi]